MRGAVAQQHGLNEIMAAKAHGYDQTDLPVAQKLALRLADALMTQPRDIDKLLRNDLQQHYSVDQVIELTLDVMKWNYQKVAVALAVDVEVRPGQLTDLVFDEQGHWVRPV